jgi:hypothetical protein
MAQAKSHATLRLIEGGARKTIRRRSLVAEHFGPPALLVRELRSSLNYCIYFCARWIGRIQRQRFEAPLGS